MTPRRLTCTICALAAMVLLGAPTAGAQTIDYSEFEDSFESFASDVASSLPLNSSIGNVTPDAYVGKLLSAPPHFSLGVTTGASTIPYDTVKDAMNQLGVDTGTIDQFSGIGVPLPAYTVDLRLGGFVLPFDVGLKLGGVPKTDFGVMPAQLEYFLAGADVRFALVEQTAALPNISIGAGYNYLAGQVFVPDAVPAGYELTIPDPSGGPDSLRFTDPDLTFNWRTSVVDFKAQISKKLLFITPYAGLGTSVGLSAAGGGLFSKLQYSDDGGPYTDVTQSDIDQIEQNFDDAGIDVPDLDPEEGISIASDVDGWAFRAFGGVGFNIFVMRLDLGVGYDILGRNLLGSVSGRIQL
jgi:hypothetical protein